MEEVEAGQQNGVELHPTLREVTVFTDRAQLTYATSVSLNVGTHILSITGEKGWESMQSNTFQVRLEDAAHQEVVLRGVSIEFHVKRDDVRQRVGELEKALETIQDDLEEINDKEAVNKAVESALEQIKGKLAVIGERAVGQDRQMVNASAIAKSLSEPAVLMSLSRYIASRKRQVGESREELLEAKNKCSEAKKRIEAELNDLRSDALHQRREASVKMTVTVEKNPVELKLLMSFVSTGASWTPLYDIRVDPGKSTMDVTYHAQVRQNTSLDWAKVRMKLSTATPHFSPSPPTLDRWCIGLKQEFHAISCMPSAMMAAPTIAMSMRCDGDRLNAPRDPPVERAVVSSSSPISTFEIVGLVGVKSDNKPVRVTIAQYTFPVQLSFHAVPKCDPQTYILAKASNESPYIFLPGKANVFAENTFLNASRLQMVPPGSEFTMSLGVDDAVKVTRKQVKQMRSTVRTVLRHPQIRVEYIYEITVQGSLNAKSTLVVRDQSPISSDNDIVVGVIEPSKQMLSKGVTADGICCSMDKMGVMEWKLLLPAGTFTRVFRFAFQVEYPEDMNVVGM